MRLSIFGLESCTGAAQQLFAYNSVSGVLSTGGLCLDSFGGGSSPGTQLDLYSCLGAGFPSQVWTMNPAGQIVSGESGLCVEENGAISGNQLALQNCDAGNHAQIWTPTP